MISTWLLAATLAAAPQPQAGVNLVITQPTQGPVVSLFGDVLVRAHVEGDVVALAGNVVLAAEADVRGEVVAVGGEVVGTGAVHGRAVSVGSLGFGTGVRSPGGQRAAWGLILLRLGGWVLVATALVLLFPRAVRTGAVRLATRPGRVTVMGGVTLAVWLAGMVLAAVVVRSPVGAGLLVGGALALLVAKTVGIVIAAWWLGWWGARWLPVRLRAELGRTGLAVGLLVAVSVVPLAGSAVWIVANVTGIGTITWGLVQRLAARRWFPLSFSAFELA